MMQVPIVRSPRLVRAAALWVTLALLVPLTLYAQHGKWQAHTSMREVLALDAGEETIWVATSGGVFSYRPVDGEVRTFTAAEGLHNVAAQALAYDAERGVVWIGYHSGVIDRLHVETGEVSSFRDIARTTRFPTRSVQRLVLRGDSLFVGTAFGLVLFDPERTEVRDSYTHFGTFPAATPVRDVAIAPGPDGEPRLWLATAAGIAHAPLDAPNLKVPDVWTTEALGAGGTGALAVAHHEGRLYVGGDEDLWRREAGGTYARMHVTQQPVTDLLVRQGALLGTSTFGLLRVQEGQARMLADAEVERPVHLATMADGTLWVGDQRVGLLGVTLGDAEAEVERQVFPEGPFYNSFSSLDIDDEGALWAAGGAGHGFYRLGADGAWTNYRLNGVGDIGNFNSVAVVRPGQRGDVWVGTPGRGVVLMREDGEFHTFNHTNSTLAAPDHTGDDYVIVESMDVDAEGNVWAANKGASLPLQVYVPDGEPSGDDWAGLSSPLGPTFTYVTVFVDSFGQKWVRVIRDGDWTLGAGVVVIDTGADPASGADDDARFFNTEGSGGVGLPSTHVNVVTEDRDGLIWVGTQEGPAYLFNTGIVPQDPSAQFIRPQLADRQEDESVFLLNGLAVYDIAVDPANRLWMGTEEGVYLVESDGGGYRIVHHFTADNSPLFDNVVRRVTVDRETGRVYLASELGLVSYSSSAIEPEEQVQDLFVYPNPVLFEEGSAPDVCVRGLVEETDVQVLTPDGALVARSQEGSGQFCWRGTDEDVWYRDAPSGVYIIAAIGRNGEGTAFGRLAIIR